MGWLTRTIDDAVAVISPSYALSRAAARADYLSVRQYLESGKLDRTSKSWMLRGSSSDIPDTGEIERSRNRAWNLYHNNTYAKKAVETIVAQVCGIAPKPQSLAVKDDGSTYDDFRKAAVKLWEEVNTKLYYRGRPGQGGMTRDEMLQSVLRLNVLTGEALLRRMEITGDEAKSVGSPIQLQYDLIEANRLDESKTVSAGNMSGNNIYRGIETDANGRRVKYYIQKASADDPKAAHFGFDAIEVPAREIIHAFRQYSPSQTRGISWFAPALVMLRNVSDAIENVSYAMKIQSCVAMAVKRASRQMPLGLATPSGGDSTDADGNKIDRMQPGLLFNLGANDAVEGFSPNVNAGNTDDFMAFLLRGFAGSLPGIKSSTITGDYRESSFSSERSAENDAWRQVEVIQEWMFSTVCQPMWEAVIEAGFRAGYFKSAVRGNLSMEFFEKNRANLLACSWEGPVPKSINPAVDEKASDTAIKTGTSNEFIECANRGMNALEVIRGHIEYCKAVKEMAESAGVPLEWVSPSFATAMKLTAPPVAAKPAAPAQDKQGDKGAKSFVLPIVPRMDVAPIYQNGVA